MSDVSYVSYTFVSSSSYPMLCSSKFLKIFLNRLHNQYRKDTLRFDLLFKDGHRLLSGLTYKDIYWYLKFSKLKPIHAKTVSKVYGHLKSDKDKQVILNGFWGVGITEAVNKMRENPKPGPSPYWINYWVDFTVLKANAVVLETKLLLCYKLLFLRFSPYEIYIPDSDSH